MIELSVSIKGEDSTYKQKFLIYEDLVMSEHDKIVRDCVDQALDNAKIQPDDIKVRALLRMQ